MQVVTGIVSLVLGLVGYGGQLISTVNWKLAQRLGLQEGDEHTEPLFRHLELNTAKWDLFTWWTLPVAGLLMLLDYPWWPYLALIACGVFVDSAGREIAKLWGLKAEGIETGTEKDARTFVVFLIVMALVGLWAAVFAVLNLTGVRS